MWKVSIHFILMLLNPFLVKGNTFLLIVLCVDQGVSPFLPQW